MEAEAPLSKVKCYLPKFVVQRVQKEESNAELVARVAKSAEKLVGKYDLKDHEACINKILNRGWSN
jgi:hypothetical protein